MKLEIKKLPNGMLQVTLAAASNKKPITVELDKVQVGLLTKLLATAQGADDFFFSLQI